MPQGSDPERLLALMRLDKKNAADALRLILWRGVGRAELVAGVDPAQVLSTLRAAVPA
jgi:3-dehydroquinate synthase